MCTIAIRLSLLLIGVCMLTACDRQDAKLRKQLIGSWTLDETNRYGSGGVTIFFANGTAHSHSSNNAAQPPIEWIYDGVWRVEDGVLLYTYTNVTVRNTSNAPPVGKTDRYKILELNAVRCVNQYEDQTNYLIRK